MDPCTIQRTTNALAIRKIKNLADLIAETHAHCSAHTQAGNRDLELLACNIRLDALARADNKKHKPVLIAKWIANSEARLQNERITACGTGDCSNPWAERITLQALQEAYVVLCAKTILFVPLTESCVRCRPIHLSPMTVERLAERWLTPTYPSKSTLPLP